MIRVAMIGYGAVASVHAAKLGSRPDVQLVSVYGPRCEKAVLFALTHGIQRVCNSVKEAVAGANVAIVCSPTSVHFEQTRECLECGVHTLVEFPPCENSGQAEELVSLAGRKGVKLACAHTSRFLAPYARTKAAIQSGRLGEIQQVNYVRSHKLRERSWTDNALLHHAGHPIDLLFFWCGGFEPIGCVALPDVRQPHTVSLLAKLPSGGPVTITVTYAARIYQVRMMIVGGQHTIETDGFSYAKSDLPELEFTGDERETYEEAILRQDIQFLCHCQGVGSFVSWEETLKILRATDAFRALAT